ncbi:MAG: GNAT family N-acetyltransferase [Chloroflexi bacterium]|nr:GNAT family N-acetyltransferase [Chloroflexota bacterium]
MAAAQRPKGFTALNGVPKKDYTFRRKTIRCSRNQPQCKRRADENPRNQLSHPQLGLWATIHKETNQFIGRCGLLPWTIEQRPEVEVACLLAKEYWGQGLGTEAAQAIVDYGFEQLKLSRLICMMYPDNQASVKVARNIGMTLEKEMENEKGLFLLYSRNVQSRVSQSGG